VAIGVVELCKKVFLVGAEVIKGCILPRATQAVWIIRFDIVVVPDPTRLALVKDMVDCSCALVICLFNFWWTWHAWWDFSSHHSTTEVVDQR
jgi:hypothetical protein